VACNLPIETDLRKRASATSRRLGTASGAAVAVLCLLYAVVLSIGLLTLPSPNHQIQEPWFTLMEILIIAISPAMVALTVALHSWVPPERKSFALAGVAFMSMCAVLTCSVHFTILTLARQPAFAGEEWARLAFSFTWPSIAYALDILAWDFFFPFAALFAAAGIRGQGLARTARGLLYASSALAFIGLAGVPLANMQIRNIGIIGYELFFPIAAVVLAKLFRQASNENAA
jgi:hypothetical protein